MDSWELLRRLAVASPDDPLWGVFFRRCVDLIRASLCWQLWAGRRVGVQPVDDLAQEVMERLLSQGRRGLLRFEGCRDETFEGYIRRIAENIQFDQFRHDWFRLEIERQLAPEELWRLEESFAEASARYSGADPEAGVNLREMDEVVETTLQEVSGDDRQRALNRLLFRLYFVDGCSIPQISRLRAVPLSPSSVARRITIIRRALIRAFILRRLAVSKPPPPTAPASKP